MRSSRFFVTEVHVHLQQFCQTRAPWVIYVVDRLSFENLKFILSLLFLLHSLTKKFCKIKYKTYFISVLVNTLKNLQMTSEEGLWRSCGLRCEVGFRICPAYTNVSSCSIRGVPILPFRKTRSSELNRLQCSLFQTTTVKIL